jgi:hypothetical protein
MFSEGSPNLDNDISALAFRVCSTPRNAVQGSFASM